MAAHLIIWKNSQSFGRKRFAFRDFIVSAMASLAIQQGLDEDDESK
jgi:hypothetical protein